MPRYIAIDTSSARLSLAAGDGHRMVAQYHGPLAWRHAESLFDGLEVLLRRARWAVSDLTGVAVSIGPGSFTGIRIGLAAARALGQARRIPVVGISALETLAFGVSRNGLVCPMIDALRGDVFMALYRRERDRLITVLPPQRQALTDSRKRLKKAAGGKPVTRAGEGTAHPFPEARDLLRLAAPRLARAGAQSYERVAPLYLREAAAVERRTA